MALRLREEAAGLVAQDHVLAHGEAAAELGVLIDSAKAQCMRVLRAADLHRPALQANLAAGQRIDTGQDLDQRGLAGPVAAQQAVHFAAEK